MSRIREIAATLRYSARCKPVRGGMYAMLAASFACMAVALSWWGPANHEHGKLLQNIEEQRRVIVDDMRSDQVMRAHREALEVLPLLERKLNARTGQADLIEGIARLASRRNVRVTSQSFEEGKTERGDALLYLDLGLRGSYPSLRLLMADFAALPMWIEVAEARFDGGVDGREVRAQLRLLAYREPRGRQ